MIAIFDLDDTLVDLETPLRGALPIIENQKGEWRYKNRNIILETIEKQQLLGKLTAFPAAIQLLHQLRHNNVKIKIITARKWLPGAEDITKENLKRNEIPYDELIICDLHEKKTDFLISSERYILSLEDNPINHMEFKNHGMIENPFCIQTAAFEYDNINPEELIHCHSEINI